MQTLVQAAGSCVQTNVSEAEADDEIPQFLKNLPYVSSEVSIYEQGERKKEKE